MMGYTQVRMLDAPFNITSERQEAELCGCSEME